jgi:hypothetical protein
MVFRAELAGRLTQEHALAVERLRVTQELTWRGVAEGFYDEFPDELYQRGDARNQLVGMLLCEVASELLERQVD